MQETKVVCPECGVGICFQCHDQWHGSESCEVRFKRKVGDALGTPLMFCAVCKTKIVRNEGCDHMTCS